MKHFWQRLVSITTVGAFLASLSVVPAQAETADFSEYGMGDLLCEEDSSTTLFNESMSTYSSNDFSNVTILDSVDLSLSVYFPEIGSQGSIGSCVAWATTYYQFTYEANKLNSVITTTSNAYSPAWTYNLLNYTTDTNDGLIYTQAYDLLARQGALKMSEYAYNVSDYSFDWPTNTAAMISALSTRLTDYVTMPLTTSATNQITNPDDSQLNSIKQLLCAGKCPIIRAYAESNLSNWSVTTTTDGEKAVYRAYGRPEGQEENPGHAMTVVGYDDSIQCDFNRNGSIENSEKGAFKIANSWGDDYGNKGYIWVMYDALNFVSANTSNDWEQSENGTRTSIFDRNSKSTNRFYYINVGNHEVNLVSLVSFTSNYRYNMNIYTNRGTSYLTSTQNLVYKDESGDEAPILNYYSGTLAFDYGTLDDDIDDLLSSTNWILRLYNNSPASIRNVQYRIADNFGTILTSSAVVGQVTSDDEYFQSLLRPRIALGDVDYDRTLTQSDAETIMNYLVRLIELSDLQKELADYDQNGVIQITDVTAMSNAMPASEAQAFKESIYATYEQNQNAQTYSMHANNDAYAELIAELYDYFEAQEG